MRIQHNMILGYPNVSIRMRNNGNQSQRQTSESFNINSMKIPKSPLRQSNAMHSADQTNSSHLYHEMKNKSLDRLAATDGSFAQATVNYTLLAEIEAPTQINCPSKYDPDLLKVDPNVVSYTINETGDVMGVLVKLNAEEAIADPRDPDIITIVNNMKLLMHPLTRTFDGRSPDATPNIPPIGLHEKDPRLTMMPAVSENYPTELTTEQWAELDEKYGKNPGPGTPAYAARAFELYQLGVVNWLYALSATIPGGIGSIFGDLHRLDEHGNEIESIRPISLIEEDGEDIIFESLLKMIDDTRERDDSVGMATFLKLTELREVYQQQMQDNTKQET